MQENQFVFACSQDYWISNRIMKHLTHTIFQIDYARDTLINSNPMEEKYSKSTSSPEALIEKHEGKTTDFTLLISM